MKIKRFIVNSAVLTGTTVFLRMSNIWFRGLICAKIGTSGIGLYQLILSIFAMTVAVCTSSAALTVTRLVAEGRGTACVMRHCLLFFLGISLSVGSLLFFGADWIAHCFLNITSGLPLRILAIGLPFMALCACLKGYFLAVRNTVIPAIAEALEQFITIGASLAFFYVFTPFSALMLASTVGEISSCFLVVVLYKIFSHKRGFAVCKEEKEYGRILHIALPVLCGTFVRSSLSSTENVLIPQCLRQYGAHAQTALSQYGIIQGMVMPILLFPSSFLSALSCLLVPELAEANANGDFRNIKKSSVQAFRFTLLFSFLITTVLIVYAEDLSIAFYGSKEAGTILRIMAPIIPLLYLDSVVDGMLKGLDQQLYSFGYNFIDSILRVLLIAALVPVFGIKAYLSILFFSEIFNASLSINRLLKTARIQIQITEWIIAPAVYAGLLYYILILLRRI